MKCKEAQLLLARNFIEKVRKITSEDLKQHLFVCSSCRAYQKELPVMYGVFHKEPFVSLSPLFKKNLKSDVFFGKEKRKKRFLLAFKFAVVCLIAWGLYEYAPPLIEKAKVALSSEGDEENSGDNTEGLMSKVREPLKNFAGAVSTFVTDMIEGDEENEGGLAESVPDGERPKYKNEEEYIKNKSKENEEDLFSVISKKLDRSTIGADKAKAARQKLHPNPNLDSMEFTKVNPMNKSKNPLVDLGDNDLSLTPDSTLDTNLSKSEDSKDDIETLESKRIANMAKSMLNNIKSDPENISEGLNDIDQNIGDNSGGFNGKKKLAKRDGELSSLNQTKNLSNDSSFAESTSDNSDQKTPDYIDSDFAHAKDSDDDEFAQMPTSTLAESTVKNPEIFDGVEDALDDLGYEEPVNPCSMPKDVQNYGSHFDNADIQFSSAMSQSAQTTSAQAVYPEVGTESEFIPYSKNTGVFGQNIKQPNMKERFPPSALKYFISYLPPSSAVATTSDNVANQSKKDGNKPKNRVVVLDDRPIYNPGGLTLNRPKNSSDDKMIRDMLAALGDDKETSTPLTSSPALNKQAVSSQAVAVDEIMMSEEPSFSDSQFSINYCEQI